MPVQTPAGIDAGQPAAAGPAMFSGLTSDELNILKSHLTSGWFKQAAVYPRLSDAWWETSWLLSDLHTAHMTHFTAVAP